MPGRRDDAYAMCLEFLHLLSIRPYSIDTELTHRVPDFRVVRWRQAMSCPCGARRASVDIAPDMPLKAKLMTVYLTSCGGCKYDKRALHEYEERCAPHEYGQRMPAQKR